jgi:anaerobic ribonucleoside-triphosphate reductase activating protein
VAGCRGNPHCHNCHNPSTWSFNQGEKYNTGYYDKLKQKVSDFNNLIDNIMIFGGDPLDQNHDELIQLLLDLKSFKKDIWIFTRYEIDEIPKEIINLCDYIKTGRYIEELKTENNIYFNIKLATSNQKIWKVSDLNI